MQRPIQVGFEHGQIDQRLLARQDSTAYRNGLIKAANWRPLAQGGVTIRSGFQVMYDEFSEVVYFMRPWETDDGRQLLIMLGPTIIWVAEVYDDLFTVTFRYASAHLWTPAVTAAELREVQMATRNDTLILTHRNHKPMVLNKLSGTTYSVTSLSFEERGGLVPEAPTWRFTSSQILMHICSTDGSYAPVASCFKGQYAFIKWTGVDPQTGLAFDPSNIELGSYLRYNGALMVVEAEAVGGYVYVKALQDLPYTIRYDVNFETDADKNRLIPYETMTCPEGNGEGLLVGVGSDFIVVTVLRGAFWSYEAASISAAESGIVMTYALAAYQENMAPTSWWEESVFSNYHGWPQACGFFQQRLWLAGSNDSPTLLCASRLNRYYDFNMGKADATDAIQVDIDGIGLGRIMSLSAGRYLQIFATTSESYVTQDRNTAIAPDTIGIKEASKFGMGVATPVIFGGNVYFVSSDRRQLRVSAWDDLAQQLKAVPVAFAHEDLLTDIAQLQAGYSLDGSPAEYLYILNEDGTLVVMFEIAVAKVRGFWPWVFDVPITSMAVLRNRLFFFKGDELCCLDPDELCESEARLKTTVVAFDQQGEGTTRGRYLRLGKIEMDVVDTVGLEINGRAMTSTDPVTGKLDHWCWGWSREPQTEIVAPAGAQATILSLLQEVTV